MATSPNFTTAPAVGSNVLSATADSSYTAPTHSVVVLSAAPVTPAQTFTQATVGSQILTASAAFTSLQPNPAPAVGWQVVGAGIAPGTTVLAISGTTLVISAGITAALSATTLSFVCNGIKVDEVDFFGTGTVVAGMVQLYLYDGTTYHAFYTLAVVSPGAPSTTVAPYAYSIPFDLVEIPPGWSLNASSFVASQLINVVGIGGYF
jgi:hypothetical protein